MYNKKFTIIFVTLILIGTSVFGQALMISQPAASVFLTETETVTVKQLEAQITALNALKVRSGQQAVEVNHKNKLEVLDMMISDILIIQGAARDGVVAEESEIASAVANQKSQFEQQLRRKFTDEEFKKLVIQETGYSWEKYRGQLEKQIVQQKYILAKKQTEIQSSVKMPENSDIEQFFRENRSKFTNPEMVRYSQVFISTLNMSPSAQQEAEKRISEAYRRYENGTSTFEEIVNDYTEDQNAKYRNGDSGYLAYNDQNAQSYLGKSFLDNVFNIKEGEVSKVLKSNIGYHIVKITEYREYKTLSLDDKLLPTVTQTVREYIAQQLILKAQNDALGSALKSLVSDLKAQADITIYEDNIN